MHCQNACDAPRAWQHVGVRSDLNLQLLEHFVVLARTRNFTRAAEELHLSQSALSRAIQRLEEQLGQPLVERKPREVQLTHLGELLLERAKHLLQLTADTFAELSEAGRKGRVRLGAIPTIAPYLLPELLSRFAKAQPEISILVQEDTTDALIKQCSHGQLDLCILSLPISAKNLEVQALFEEELLLVLPVGHPLSQAKSVPIEALNGFPFVTLNEAHCLSHTIASYCRQQAVQPITIERTSQLTMVQELVTLNHGISLVPEMARKVDASERRIYRSFSGEKPSRTVAMMWNPDRFQSISVKKFMSFLRDSKAHGKRTAER
jgi:LysR family transcriptional regulator, hydrogen peroxide-inducible genes activator